MHEDADWLAVSVFDWGEYLTREQRAPLLAKALGLADEDARLLGSKTAPVAIGLLSGMSRSSDRGDGAVRSHGLRAQHQ